MSRLSLHPFRQQQSLLAACTTLRPVTAPHLAGTDKHRPLSFDDIRALPDPEWADTNPAIRFWPGRYAVGALVPAGQLAVVPLLPPMRDPAADPQPIAALLDRAEHVRCSRDIAFEEVLTDARVASAARCEAIAAAVRTDDRIGEQLAASTDAVLDAVAAQPELRHEHVLLMYLAPVVAMLKGSVA